LGKLYLKVEPDGPNTGTATTILKVEPREPKVEPEGEHALKPHLGMAHEEVTPTPGVGA